jgi:hypothetical protein
MNGLIWQLPRKVHRFILRLTGLRLVRIEMDDSAVVRYTWTRHYPLR